MAKKAEKKEPKNKQEEKKEEKLTDKKEQNFIGGLIYGFGGALIVVVILLLVIFSGSIFGRSSDDNDDQDTADTDDGLPALRMTIIASKDCLLCFDVNLVADALRQRNINELGTETLDADSASAQQLIARYNIDKLPTILVAGDLDKDPALQEFWASLGEIVDGVFVFRQVVPPYIEVATGELRGLVKTTYISDESCEECYDVMLHQNALVNLGVVSNEEVSVDVSSDEGKALVEQYAINLVPTIIMQGDVAEYLSIAQIWATYGTISDDGTYIFTSLDAMGTYKNLETGEITEVELPSMGGEPTQ